MPNIIIYSKDICPYCVRAKMLLDNKGAQYEEIKVTTAELMEEVIEKSGGRRTVPQIFIGDRHVGGFDDLHELDVKGELDELLK